MHLPFAARRRVVLRSVAAAEAALRPSAEVPAELLLHLAAHALDPPAEEEHGGQCQQYNSHNEIQYEQRDAFQQGRSTQRQQENHQHRERIALHEPHEGIDDFG